MKKYLIYTTNSTEPFVVETEENLIDEYLKILRSSDNIMFIKHKKDLIGRGTYKIDMLLNVNQVVSITTSENV